MINPEAAFVDDLEPDSLDVVKLIMAFEEKFGQKMPDEPLKKSGPLRAPSTIYKAHKN